MLVPSGNDAAYVVADYCGSILSPQAKNSQERINVFIRLRVSARRLGFP